MTCKPHRTCETCLFEVEGRCRVLTNTQLPPSVRFLASEHLYARQTNRSDRDKCFVWRAKDCVAARPKGVNDDRR